MNKRKVKQRLEKLYLLLWSVFYWDRNR